MKYFAMINGVRKGPFELSEFPKEGITPETYIWCKGMSDWRQAGDVADVCRFYRNHIFDILHPSDPKIPESTVSAENDSDLSEDELSSIPLRYRHMVRKSGERPGTPIVEQPDFTSAPMSMMALAIIVTLVCFPPTGLFAIYYSYMSAKTWKESQRSDSKSSKELYSDEERKRLRRLSHDFSRSAKMWTGITFFLGFLLYAFIFRP